jgi:hypothetical protein
MAIDTTIDNAVIDYSQISNILQTVKSHDDLFVKLSTGSLGSFTAAGSTAATSSLSPSNFHIAGVQAYVNVKNGAGTSGAIPFGKIFASPPVVVVTCQYAESKANLFAQLIELPTTDSCKIAIGQVGGSNLSGSVLVHIMAFGALAG